MHICLECRTVEESMVRHYGFKQSNDPDYNVRCSCGSTDVDDAAQCPECKDLFGQTEMIEDFCPKCWEALEAA